MSSSPSPIESIRHAESQLRFIKPEALIAIRNLSLVAKAVVEGFISGMHRSPYHGFSVDFAEYRSYVPGDDIRSVDWKVYARSDKFFVKKFEGDTNTQIYLLLDCSKSMGFASHAVSKLDYGRFLAASLAYMCQRQKDAVGLMTFDKKILDYTPARIRRGQLHTLLHHLDRAERGEQTDIAAAVTELANYTRKRNLLVLISDFYQDPEAVAKALRLFHFRGNDLVIFHLLDPIELDPPFQGTVTLEDVETGEHLTFNSDSRKQYLARLEEHIAELRKSFSEMNVDYEVLNTERPLDAALRRYLTARSKQH